jgi:hypothetical protein
MNIKSVFRLSLILALVAVPLTGFAQEGEQGTAASLGQPGPWIFTFFGTEYTISSAIAASGNVEPSIEPMIHRTLRPSIYDTESGATVDGHDTAFALRDLAAAAGSDRPAGRGI